MFKKLFDPSKRFLKQAKVTADQIVALEKRNGIIKK